MKTIFLKTLQNHKWTLIAFSAINILLLLVFVSMFPEMQEQSDVLTEAFSNYPETFLKAFGADMQMVFESLEGFIGTEHYSLMWPLMMFIFAINLGVAAVAGEIDNGTIELLLAQPLSRIRIYVSKLLTGIVLITLFSAISILSIIPMAMAFGVDYDLKSHLMMFILGVMFGLAVYGVSMLASSTFSSKGKASFFLTGMSIVMYAFNLISALQEDFDFLKYFSFFYYFDYSTAMFDYSIGWESMTVFLGIGIVSLLIGAMALEKRDVAV